MMCLERKICGQFSLAEVQVRAGRSIFNTMLVADLSAMLHADIV